MLESKTALITGAASGIGLATVERFSQDPKYNPIYAVDKNPFVETTFPLSEYPNVVPVQVDVRDREQIKDILRRTVLESGRLDVVVNAAGVMNKGRLSTYANSGTPTSKWTEMEDVNLWAPILIMTEAAPIMQNTGGGVIVNIASAKYLFPDIHHIPYQSGKMRLSKVTRKLAKFFTENYGVRLVDVQPGNTRTNIDRGDWTDGSSQAEMEVVQSINVWWRKIAGNDPKNVAEVIYGIAEGRINRSPVYVGLDTKIGRALFLATYPTIAYRWDGLFYAGSGLVYQLATWASMLRRRIEL